MGEQITIQLLDTGYFRAQGSGPCEWAQWPKHRFWVKDEEFFPEASDKFREQLRKRLKELYETV